MVINHAHLGHLIEATLGDGARWGLRIRYSPEDQALKTAGGIAHALALLGEAPFLVVNGDVFTDFDVGRARSIALQMDAARLDAWCVMVPNPAQHPRGDFTLRGGLLMPFDQGPSAHRQQRLGAGVGERAHALAAAGCQDHRAHRPHRPRRCNRRRGCAARSSR